MWYKLRCWIQLRSDRKPPMGFRLGPWPLTLDDPEPSYFKVITVTVKYYNKCVLNATALGRFTFHTTYFLLLLIKTCHEQVTSAQISLSCTWWHITGCIYAASSRQSFQQCTLLVTNDVITDVYQPPDKSSAADPISTTVLKLSVNIIASLTVEVFNCLLSTRLAATFK